METKVKMLKRQLCTDAAYKYTKHKNKTPCTDTAHWRAKNGNNKISPTLRTTTLCTIAMYGTGIGFSSSFPTCNLFLFFVYW